MREIKSISNPYVSQYVGNINEDVKGALNKYQTKQDTVIASANELDDALSTASSKLDEEDRIQFDNHAKNAKDSLMAYTDDKYVGNLDRKIRSEASKFKNMYTHYAENTARKQKFAEELTKEDIPEDEKMLYLQEAKKRSGVFNYDPITGSATNKFTPTSVIKPPKQHELMGELDGLMHVKEEQVYINPITKQVSSTPDAENGFTQVQNRKYKILDKEGMNKIEMAIASNPENQKYYQRMAQIGGKEYAEKKFKQLSTSIGAGISLGDFDDRKIDYTGVAADELKKGNTASGATKANPSDVSGYLLPAPINKKIHDAEDLGDLNTMANNINEKKDPIKAGQIANYAKRVASKYGLEYGKDYEQTTFGFKVLNDSKKHLIEQANADVKKDALMTTRMYKTFGFDKDADNKVLDRQFQQTMGNLTTSHMFGDDKNAATFIPEDSTTNEPLSTKQMKNMKNVQFAGTILTSNGVYHLGRSNSSTSDQDKSESGDSDFQFRIKIPNQSQVLDTMVNTGKIKREESMAYQSLQGLDDTFGEYKRIKTPKGEMIVKRNLPSEVGKDGGEYTIKTPNGSKNVGTFQELLNGVSNFYKK